MCMNIKAIAVRQPWAWAIMAGIKRVENRTWTTRYRGPLAIVAGQSKSSLRDGVAFCESLGVKVPIASLAFGSLLGVVILTDVVSIGDIDDPFAEGPFCWLLDSPVKLDRPVPVIGRLGLFSVKSELLQMENQ